MTETKDLGELISNIHSTLGYNRAINVSKCAGEDRQLITIYGDSFRKHSISFQINCYGDKTTPYDITVHTDVPTDLLDVDKIKNLVEVFSEREANISYPRLFCTDNTMKN